MMKLGFVSAILPDLTLEQVLHTAADIGYDCVEVMCWPPGKATRRYAGVTHIDVTHFSEKDAREIQALQQKTCVSISALGYYPNPLSPSEEESTLAIAHLRKLIETAPLLGLNVVNTFIGRDWTKSVEDNWPRFLEVWKPLIAHAEQHGVKIGIENCPMSFTADEWPGGKNLKTSPAIFRRMYADIPSGHFGLNFDPSHYILQHMDYVKTIREFGGRFFHVHAKDARIDRERLDDVGVFAHPNQFHTPKLPGMGDVDWGRFFSALTDADYQGAVCVEVEDRAFEGSLEKRIAALRQSYDYLRCFLPKGA